MATSLVAPKKVLVDWIREATGLPATKVLLADQNFPRPPKDYITLKFGTMLQVGREFIAAPNGAGSAPISRDMEATIFFNSYGDKAGVVNPLTRLVDLLASIDTEAINEDLIAGGIHFIDTLLPPTDITTVLNTQYEPRATMDLRFRLDWETTDSGQGFIDKAEIESKTFSPTERTKILTVDAS